MLLQGGSAKGTLTPNNDRRERAAAREALAAREARRIEDDDEWDEEMEVDEAPAVQRPVQKVRACIL